MAFLSGANQPPSLDLQPIISHAKIADKPIEQLLCNGTTAIACVGGRAILLGTYYPLANRPAAQSEVAAMIKGQRLPAYTGTSEARKLNGKTHHSLHITKRKGVRVRNFYTNSETVPAAKVPSVFCTNRDGTILSWTIPGAVVIHELVTRSRALLATIPVPGLIPTAITSRPGVLLIGTSSGEVYSLSFQPNAIHFIFSLAGEKAVSPRK